MADAAPGLLLLRAPNWLGDAVLALPAMAALERQFPKAECIVAAPPSTAAVYREQTNLRSTQVLELPANRKQARAELARAQADVAVLFPNSFRSAWELRRSGIRERWGFSTAGRGVLLTRSARVPKGRVHQSDYYRELVRGLGFDARANELPKMSASAASRARATALLERHKIPAGTPLVAFLPGAAYGQAKQYPPARIAEVISRLVSEREVACVMLGAAHDVDAARAIESDVRARAPHAMPRLIDLVGKTDLGSLAGMLAQSAVCVSNDSGGMHVASALGRPVVAIFGPTQEWATRPAGDHDLLLEPVFCRPCMLRDCPIDHRCMKRITVDRVFDAVAARLTSSATSVSSGTSTV